VDLVHRQLWGIPGGVGDDPGAVLWLAYPIVWILGTEGFRLYGGGWETLLIAVLDVSAKVGYGFLLLSGLRALAPHSAPAGRVETAGGGRALATEMGEVSAAD